MGSGVRVHSTLKKGWGAQVQLSPNFLEWGIDCGLLLAHLGSRVLDLVNDRTDHGYDVYGTQFARYKERWALQRHPDGSIKRNPDGTWLPPVQVRGSSSPVTLRSLQDVPTGHRMRDNLVVVPKVPNRRTTQVTVKLVGGRRNEYGKREWVGHIVRAAAVSGMLAWRAQQQKMLPRPFIGVSDQDMAKLMRETTRAGVLAWLHGKRGRTVVDARIRQALNNQKRVTKARRRAAKRAETSARRRHENDVQRLKRLGVRDGETAQEAWKRKSREKRTRTRILKSHKGAYKTPKPKKKRDRGIRR